MKQKLMRTNYTDKVLLGVLGGFARYFGIKPIILRILFVIGLFPTSFLLIIPYTILSYIMPREQAEESSSQ